MAFHPPGSTAGNVKFKFQGVAYEIWVEVLRRAFRNDVRYTPEKDQKVLASVDIIFKRGERFPAVLLRTPVQGSFRRTGSTWSRHFELHSDSKLLAAEFHPHWINLRVHLAAEITADQRVLPLVFAAYMIKEILYWARPVDGDSGACSVTARPGLGVDRILAIALQLHVALEKIGTGTEGCPV